MDIYLRENDLLVNRECIIRCWMEVGLERFEVRNRWERKRKKFLKEVDNWGIGGMNVYKKYGE